MWMAELSSRAGLPVATIKFYLRDGLLHPGEATGATRARYDESHVRRLRLIRALRDVAHLRLEDIRQVLATVDDPSVPRHRALGSAHVRLTPESKSAPPSRAAVDRVERLLARHGWELGPTSPHRLVLAQALDALASVDHPVGDALLDTYAEALESVATAELAAMPSDLDAAAEYVVLGTLLLEPVLLTMRRIAQENASRRQPPDD